PRRIASKIAHCPSSRLTVSGRTRPPSQDSVPPRWCLLDSALLDFPSAFRLISCPASARKTPAAAVDAPDLQSRRRFSARCDSLRRSAPRISAVSPLPENPIPAASPTLQNLARLPPSGSMRTPENPAAGVRLLRGSSAANPAASQQ